MGTTFGIYFDLRSGFLPYSFAKFSNSARRASLVMFGLIRINLSLPIDLSSAIMREESRGAHSRIDFERESDEWLQYNIVL